MHGETVISRGKNKGEDGGDKIELGIVHYAQDR